MTKATGTKTVLNSMSLALIPRQMLVFVCIMLPIVSHESEANGNAGAVCLPATNAPLCVARGSSPLGLLLEARPRSLFWRTELHGPTGEL